MKKVIFVCLLTLSVCLSDTAVNPDKTSKPGNETAPATPPAGTPATAQAASTTNETKAKEPENATQNATNVTPAPQKNDKTNATTNTTNATTNTTNAATNTTEKSTTVIPAKPAEHNNGTAPAAPTSEKSTTAKPTATTAQPHTLQARGFDGASFVGGIILTLGLLAIGFMGFRYYKAQTERNYHTL